MRVPTPQAYPPSGAGIGFEPAPVSHSSVGGVAPRLVVQLRGLPFSPDRRAPSAGGPPQLSNPTTMGKRPVSGPLVDGDAVLNSCDGQDQLRARSGATTTPRHSTGGPPAEDRRDASPTSWRARWFVTRQPGRPPEPASMTGAAPRPRRLRPGENRPRPPCVADRADALPSAWHRDAALHCGDRRQGQQTRWRRTKRTKTRCA